MCPGFTELGVMSILRLLALAKPATEEAVKIVLRDEIGAPPLFSMLHGLLGKFLSGRNSWW